MTFTDVKFNREELRDKIFGCWIGKNIGGTMGAPFEGKREMLDIPGYTTPKGEPLPNDDLDLQLIWLRTLEHVGPFNLDMNTLGYQWLRYIPASWNEYGIGKANMKMGLLPPMSGEVNNEAWRNSNGAWIRSEIWACLAPGFPHVATHYAIMDACIDHGVSEGTVAEIFTACLESLAFFETDVRTVIEKALTHIPEDSRIAQDVRLVMAEYDKGTPYRDVRNMIVEHDKDLGWFQAPANIAYTVIGLLYGEGDFKQSLIYAINCGDDTDCTAATVGALLGIMGGMAAIPEDWKDHIGDNIITVAINRGDVWGIVNTCTDLTERIMKLAPEMLRANRANLEIVEGESDLTEVNIPALSDTRVAKKLYDRSPWSYDVEFVHTQVRVSFDDEPVIKPNGTLKGKFIVKSIMPDPRNIEFNWILPEGWSVDAPKSVYLRHWYNLLKDKPTEIEFTITAGEQVDAMNRIVVEAKAPGRPTVGYIPVTVLG